MRPAWASVSFDVAARGDNVASGGGAFRSTDCNAAAHLPRAAPATLPGFANGGPSHNVALCGMGGRASPRGTNFPTASCTPCAGPRSTPRKLSVRARKQREWPAAVLELADAPLTAYMATHGLSAAAQHRLRRERRRHRNAAYSRRAATKRAAATAQLHASARALADENALLKAEVAALAHARVDMEARIAAYEHQLRERLGGATLH